MLAFDDVLAAQTIGGPGYCLQPLETDVHVTSQTDTVGAFVDPLNGLANVTMAAGIGLKLVNGEMLAPEEPGMSSEVSEAEIKRYKV